MILKNGSTGDDVKRIQRKLGIHDTGHFGPATEARVKAWQANNNLPDDGIVGDDTWSAMFPAVIGSIHGAKDGLSVVDHLDKSCDFNKLSSCLREEVINEISIDERLTKLNPLQLSHFLAQCSVESNDFQSTVENLNYSKHGLLSVFESHFTAAEAEHYAHQPERIANRVYANRMGNGDEASGDGWKFRGRGYIQLTGEYMYDLFGKYVGDPGIMDHPDLVATKYPLDSALFYFDSHKLWDIAVQGIGDHVVRDVTSRINPALLHLQDRIHMFNTYYKKLIA